MTPQQELDYLRLFIKLSDSQAQKRDDLEQFLESRNKEMLVDADSMLFNVCHFNIEKYAIGEVDFDTMYCDFMAQFQEIGSTIEADGITVEDYTFYFTTCTNNFRKQLDSNYKANRERTPLTELVYKFKKFVIHELELEEQSVRYDMIYEADDLIAMDAEQGYSIVVSIDKDLRQIPGAHFDYYKIKTGEQDANGYDIRAYRGWSYTTKQEGTELLHSMLLEGDTSDNIKGVNGIGKKKAAKLLSDCSPFNQLVKVARAYDKQDGNLDRLRINLALMKL